MVGHSAFFWHEANEITTLITSILDLENSNLPIDYFTSVLPRAQYGDIKDAVAAANCPTFTASNIFVPVARFVILLLLIDNPTLAVINPLPTDILLVL